MNEPRHTLRTEDVCVNDLQPLRLEVAGGECVCVSGPSGSGKTLLLRAIADLDPHAGEVYLDDVACRAMRPTEWRRQVGLLPAESQWWEDTVGPHFNGVEPALLQQVGFERDVLQWKIARLSSGERQRLALLRLLSGAPCVLLLDEPTANLDTGNIERIEKLLAKYRSEHGACILWVSHDPQQILRVAHRHYRIEAGALREQEMRAWV